MNAIISRGDKTAHVQLPVGRKQLSGALSYLGANHTSDYDLKYNEENKDGLKVSLECFGVVENAIAKALPVGFRLYTLNETLTLMGNLPYQNRREVENTIKVDGLESYEQLNRMLTEAYPQSVTTKYYCPLTIQVHSRDSYGDIDEDGYEEDAEFAARHEDLIRQKMLEYNASDEVNMAEYFHGNHGVSEKLCSADWDFERRNGELYGCITVQTAGPLTEDEEQDLKEWISGQNSDGLGEGFEQQEIYFDGTRYGGFMYVSLWNSGDDYYIDNQDEFENRLMSDGIIEGEVCPEHIHMLVSIPPKMSISGFMGYLKGKSALLIFQKWGNMKFAYRNREFWCKGYYVDTVGKNTKAIKEYIADQLKRDQDSDQISMFDPRDPFMGSK